MALVRSVGRNMQAFPRFMALPRADPNLVMVEYVWIDAKQTTRSKMRTLPGPITSPDQLPHWNFDGSSTGQAVTERSEVRLKPVKIVPDPFRPQGGNNLLALCECLDPETKEPIATNSRHRAAAAMNAVAGLHPWFGIEQEYTLFEHEGRTPLGWPKGGFPAPQGPYYCSAGSGRAVGREVVEAHFYACLYAGIKVCGINAEVMPAQWEYQVGPSEGIDAADELWLSRYIMDRVCEEFDVVCSYANKPVKGDWNGTGAHCNFSTLPMREEGGFEVIKQAIALLEEKHAEHMEVYGEDNKERLSGAHETAPYENFSWGVGNRAASIRVPTATAQEGKGWLEDRRPGANMDPYLVTGKLVETTCLGGAPAS